MFFVEIIFYFIWIVIVDASSHSTAATQKHKFEHTQKKYETMIKINVEMLELEISFSSNEKIK